MPDRLPHVPDLAAWERLEELPRDQPAFVAAALHIARRHGFAADAASRFSKGSLPVLDVGGETVVKLFPPIHAQECEREESVLRCLDGRLPVPVPGVLARGEHDGWSYLLMERLRGRPLGEVWSRIDRATRGSLVEETGRAIAALHAIPAADLPELAPEWATFLRAQVEGCVAHHRGRGLEEEWIARIPAALAAAGGARDRGERVLLHTEVMRDHVLVEEGPAGWRLTGLVDFEPAMVGDPEYELASVAVFVVGGELDLWERFFAGFGEPAPGWRPRVMASLLLHRYSNFPWYRDLLPCAGAKTFEDLARCWLGPQETGASGSPAC